MAISDQATAFRQKAFRRLVDYRETAAHGAADGLAADLRAGVPSCGNPPIHKAT